MSQPTVGQFTSRHMSVVVKDGTATPIAASKVLTTTDAVASGPTRRVGGRVTEATSQGTPLTNSTTETALATYAIPANTFKAGTRLKVKAMVAVTANASTTTLTVRLRLGGVAGTSILATAAVDTSAGDIATIDFDLISRAAPSASSAICGHGMYCDPGAVGSAMKMAALAATNFATNGALDLVVTGQWSAADGNTCACETFEVEFVG